MADSIKIVEDIEMAQETNEEEKKGSGPSWSSRISTENSEKLKINELFNNNLKGLVNELIGSEIASEFDERIWVQSVEEDSSSKLSDLFRESDDGLIIIHSTLFRYRRSQRVLSSLARAGTTCQSIKKKERSASSNQWKIAPHPASQRLSK